MFLKWWLTAYQQAHSPTRLLAMNFWIGLPEMGIRPSLATQEIVFSRGDYPTKALLTRALDELKKHFLMKQVAKFGQAPKFCHLLKMFSAARKCFELLKLCNAVN